MSLPSRISTANLARLLGVSERTIGKLVDKGVLRRASYGTFDVTDSVQAFISYREQVAAGEREGSAYARARAALTLERARLMRLKREALEGTLLRTDEVIAADTAVYGHVRNRVLAIADKTAPRAFAAKSVGEVRALIYRDCCEACEELATTEVVPTRYRRSRKRGQPGADAA
jgi:phage terminase Nu1 subunit (DNA packaging protein)